MSYIGNQPVLSSSFFREEFSVTTNQTVFNTGGFGEVEVYRNGVLLGEDDYTLGSDKATITLGSAAVSGDIIVVTGQRELVQGVQVTEHTEEIIATASTTVTVGNPAILNSGRTHVYLNGVKQQMTTIGGNVPDISSIDNNTGVITFATTLAAGDLVTVVTREQSVSDDISQVSHYSALPDSFTVPQGVNQSFFGPTTYEGTVNVAGNLVHAHGAFNLTGTMTVSGSLNVV